MEIQIPICNFNKFQAFLLFIYKLFINVYFENQLHKILLSE